MVFEKYKEYAFPFVRWGVGIVFLLFGISQAFTPEKWIAWMPLWTMDLPIALLTLIIVLGVFNIIVGGLLILGLFVRIAALLGALHLIGVIYGLGYNDISIRDFGLLLAAIAILLHGNDKLCLGRKFGKNPKNESYK